MNELSKSDLEFIINYCNEHKDLVSGEDKDFYELVTQLVFEFENK